MLIVLGTDDRKTTILDTVDNSKEVVPVELAIKLANIVHLENVDYEYLKEGDSYIEAQDITSYDIIAFEKYDTFETASKKVEKIKPHSKVKAYNNSDITDMSEMFCGYKFDELDLTDFDTSKVTNMTNMFLEAEIKELTILFNTSKVKSMNSMFANFQGNITDSELSLDTSNVVDMAYMFSYSNIDFIRLYFDTSNVKDMTSMFEHFAGHVDLNSFTTTADTKLDNMFDGIFDEINDYDDLVSLNFDINDKRIRVEFDDCRNIVIKAWEKEYEDAQEELEELRRSSYN